MLPDKLYAPSYRSSWALLVGINRYQLASPLLSACSDADEIARLLAERFEFPTEQIMNLRDEAATRDAIRTEFLRFADVCEEDDRVVVFFAGHGFTRRGHAGEVGFLVPVDGDPADLASLIPWNELTHASSLIPAKHILFIIDACYGGLALRRAVPPGSMRFLKDMLRRYARQVLTAGKADETVSDAGGPIPDHSVFTGHLIAGLEGAAATSEGIITAVSLMTYVYTRVAQDSDSQQTPHFGFFEGDGDLVLTAQRTTEPSTTGNDVLLSLPPLPPGATTTSPVKGPIEAAKEFLSEPRFQIRLGDLVTQEIRSAVYRLSEDRFPVKGPRVVDRQFFAERLQAYELESRVLEALGLLLGRYGQLEHQSVAQQQIASRLAEHSSFHDGLVELLAMRWYPLVRVAYATGIGAMSARNYGIIASVLTTPTISRFGSDEQEPLVMALGKPIADMEEIFKILPGHEEHYAARSEYLFTSLQPQIEDLLFLGRSYESAFDQFEILLALVHADLSETEKFGLWGPIGRFGWKHFHPRWRPSPFANFVLEVESQGPNSPILRSGLFNGSLDRFSGIARSFAESLGKLHWF